jgi:hypothetical protein
MKDMPTVFINPDVDFVRDSNYKGTVIVKDPKEFQEKIDEYYTTGKVEAMYDKNKIQAREKIIKDVIGFADGLNHIRAGYYLKKTIESLNAGKKKRVKLNLLYFVRYILVKLGAMFYYKPIFMKLPKFKKTVWIFDRHKLKNIDVTGKKYYSYLEDFHLKNNLPAKIDNKSFWDDLII